MRKGLKVVKSILLSWIVYIVVWKCVRLWQRERE